MLELVLHPLLPPRRPGHGGSDVCCGYGLRLPGGFAVEDGDPLLASFGAVVARVEGDDGFGALQSTDFAPGAAVRLLAGTGDPDEVSVWSADGVRHAGAVGGAEGAQLAAALEVGVELVAHVLCEWADLRTGERSAVDVVAGPRAQLGLAVPAGEAPLRPARTARRRLVLIADGEAALDLWDPAGDHGPVDPAQVGLSPELQRRVARLRAAFARRPPADEVRVGLDRLRARWTEEELTDESTLVWRQLRAELHQRFDVGFLGPGMAEPAWDPADLEEDDDGIPF